MPFRARIASEPDQEGSHAAKGRQHVTKIGEEPMDEDGQVKITLRMYTNGKPIVETAPNKSLCLSGTCSKTSRRPRSHQRGRLGSSVRALCFYESRVSVCWWWRWWWCSRMRTCGALHVVDVRNEANVTMCACKRAK